MKRVDHIFLLLASTCLVVGVSMGIGMGVAHDFQLATVHAHLNLVGWVSLALFGLAYRAYPALAASRLAILHLAASGTSGVAFPIGLYFAVAQDKPGFAIVASLGWFAGACLFLANLVWGFVLPRVGVQRRILQAVDA